MSTAHVVITAVVVEGRSQAEVARACGVSRSWVSRLVARWRVEGEAAFQPLSRRPKTSPGKPPVEVIDIICALRRELAGAGHDAGPVTIAWHLRHHHGLTVAPSTIARHLRAAGLVDPAPRKRPKSSWTRFAAVAPNECWQADFTHYRLVDDTDIEILTFLDDHSRYALSVTHRALPHGATPMVSYAATPTPTDEPHHRVRRDVVDTNGKVTLRLAGRLHHIGLGRTHARTPIILLIDDHDVRIIDAATGELLRELTIDPTRDYQPTGKPRNPTKQRNSRT